jgi:hypothetical protein
MVDFGNCTDIGFERKEQTSTGKVPPAPAAAAAGGGGNDNNNMHEATRDIWRDATPPEDASVPILPNSYTQALLRVTERTNEMIDVTNDDVDITRPVTWNADNNAKLRKICEAYVALRPRKTEASKGDIDMIKFLIDYKNIPPLSDPKAFISFIEKLGLVCRECSHGGSKTGNEQSTIGVLTWYISRVQPTLKVRAAIVMKILFEAEPCLLSDNAIKQWYNTDTTQLIPYLPCVSEEEEGDYLAIINSIKIDKGIVDLIPWLDVEEESDEEEGSDEEDDD